jgi:hypothetical protein
LDFWHDCFYLDLGNGMTPQEQDDEKVRRDLEATNGKWGEHVPEGSAAAEDEQLARARQRIAELEYALLHPFSAESFALREEIARLKGL